MNRQMHKSVWLSETLGHLQQKNSLCFWPRSQSTKPLTWHREKWAPLCWGQWCIPRSSGSLCKWHCSSGHHRGTTPWSQSAHTRRCGLFPDQPPPRSAQQRSAGRQTGRRFIIFAECWKKKSQVKAKGRTVLLCKPCSSSARRSWSS